MKIKKQTNRNAKVIALSFFAIFVANSSLAFDLETIYAGHTEYCMTQLNNEEQDLIKRLFSSEITEECVRYAIKKTGEEFGLTCLPHLPLMGLHQSRLCVPNTCIRQRHY